MCQVDLLPSREQIGIDREVEVTYSLMVALEVEEDIILSMIECINALEVLLPTRILRPPTNLLILLLLLSIGRVNRQLLTQQA